MSRGYRLLIVALAGLITIGGSVGYGLLQQTRYEQEAEHRRADYARNTADQIRQSCAPITPPQQAKCLANGGKEYALKTRDNQREYDDLVAQKTSALWTGIMGIAALLGMLLSAVGVLLVWTTFQETKRTNLIAMRENARSTRRAIAGADETARALLIAERNADAAARQVEVAQDTARRELRAYVSIHAEGEGTIQAGEKIKIPWRLTNTGATPAKDLRFASAVFVRPPGYVYEVDDFIDDEVLPALALAPRGKHLVYSDSDFELPQETWDSIKKGRAIIHISGVVFYQDVFGESRETRVRARFDASSIEHGNTLVLDRKGNIMT